MAIAENREQNEHDKFLDSGGVTTIRVIQTTSSNTSSALSTNREQNELNKFVEDDSGNTAIVLLV